MRKTSKMETVVAGQTQPSNLMSELSLTDLYFHVLAAVETLAMNTAIFETDNTTTEVVTPANLALYLWGLCLSHINIVGTLSGSNKNDVCMHPDEMVLPTGFAKFLEHLGPYTEDGCTIRTCSSLSTSLTTNTATFGGANSGTFWGAAPVAAGWPSDIFYSTTQQSSTIGELKSVEVGFLMNLEDMWVVGAPLISQAIANAGLSCVRYKDIPKRAPNASAYATCFNTFTGVVDVPSNCTIGAQWTCFSSNYDPEEANLFKSFQAGDGLLYIQNNQKPVVYPSPGVYYDTSISTSRQLTFTTPHFLNAWLGSRQEAYRPGPVLRSYLLCKVPVKSFAISYQQISSNSIFRVAYAVCNQFLRQITNTLTDAEILQLIYLYYQITIHCVLARVNQSIPKHTLCGTSRSTGNPTPGNFAPQCGYISRAWLSIPLPAPLVRFIDSIGPMLVDNQIIVPQLTISPQTANPNYSNGTIFPLYGIGQSAGITAYTLGYFGVPGVTLAGTIPSLGFSPQGTAITTGAIQAYFADGTAYARNFFWNCQLPYFAGLWDRLHKKAFSGVGLASSLIHLHNPPCGSAAAMVSGVLVDPGDETVNIPDLSFGAGFSGTFVDAQALLVGSYVDLLAEDIVEATMFRWKTYGQGNFAGSQLVGKFTYRLPTSAASSQLIQSYTSKTFSPESSFSKALSAREAEFDPILATAGGVDVVSTEDTRGCWIRDLLKTVGRETFTFLKYATPAAAGLVCNYFLPGTGGFCANGADKVVKTMSSWSRVEAADHIPPTQAEIKKVKQTIMPKPSVPVGRSRNLPPVRVKRAPPPGPAKKPKTNLKKGKKVGMTKSRQAPSRR